MTKAREGGGLTDAEVDRLREQLAAGTTPRVRVSGPQFADRPSGAVIAIGKPEVDGEEYLTVRVRAGGVSDELRFSPRELATVGRRQAVPGPTMPASSGRRPKGTKPARGAQQRTPAADTAPSAPRPPATKEASAGAESPQARNSPAAAAKKAAATGSKPRRSAPLPTVTVTLTSADATWSVSAHRGARAVVKHAPVPPGVVSAIADLLALPPVADAVAAVNDAARIEAETRAAALRAELAALEAQLDSHRRP